MIMTTARTTVIAKAHPMQANRDPRCLHALGLPL
jgi:hypothetical protein